MNKIILVLILGLTVLMIGCKKNDESESTPYLSNYEKQDLQGKINGQAWKYLRGGAFTYSKDNIHEVGLYSDSADSCIGGSGPSVLIHLDKDIFIGEIKLGSGSNANAINIYYYENDYINQYPKKGGLEIISADTISGIVKGRIDAWYNDDNHVNGNFEIIYCDYFN